ncbi:unnamed protein product [Prorocentrum cordatum]|uniref:PH domain-containing protein n=1 Tax=Prorocentrum cordatum TaxID=2364126 RepID=A0ABN9UHF5_9DINO|nr:unnamed protein product [Polarella glacialis]
MPGGLPPVVLRARGPREAHDWLAALAAAGVAEAVPPGPADGPAGNLGIDFQAGKHSSQGKAGAVRERRLLALAAKAKKLHRMKGSKIKQTQANERNLLLNWNAVHNALRRGRDRKVKARGKLEQAVDEEDAYLIPASVRMYEDLSVGIGLLVDAWLDIEALYDNLEKPLCECGGNWNWGPDFEWTFNGYDYSGLRRIVGAQRGLRKTASRESCALWGRISKYKSELRSFGQGVTDDADADRD